MAKATPKVADASSEETDPTVTQYVDSVSADAQDALNDGIPPELENAAAHALDLLAQGAERRPLLAISIAAVTGYIFAFITR